METQIIKFGLSTPTLVIIQDEMPKSRVINLLIDHVVDDEDARAAIELVCGSPAGGYDGNGWSFWFAMKDAILH